METLMNYLYTHSFHYANIIHILNVLESSDSLSSKNDIIKLKNLLNVNIMEDTQTQDLKNYNELINTILALVKKYEIEISYPNFPCEKK